MTTDDLSRKVAEHVGDEGFWPAERCPQGHDNIQDPESGARQHNVIGMACCDCIRDYLLAHEPGLAGGLFWNRFGAMAQRLRDHPEEHRRWRIGRGEPKPYGESLDLLVPVVRRECVERQWVWQVRQVADGRFLAVLCRRFAAPKVWNSSSAVLGEPAEALATVFLDAIAVCKP